RLVRPRPPCRDVRRARPDVPNSGLARPYPRFRGEDRWDDFPRLAGKFCGPHPRGDRAPEAELQEGVRGLGSGPQRPVLPRHLAGFGGHPIPLRNHLAPTKTNSWGYVGWPGLARLQGRDALRTEAPAARPRTRPVCPGLGFGRGAAPETWPAPATQR